MDITILKKGGIHMPFGNGTGPNGSGPMTGRGAGYCSGNASPGSMNYTFRGGRNFGWFGGGRGRGFRHIYNATGLPAWARYNNPDIPPESTSNAAEEREMLKLQAQNMQHTLEAINERIQALEKLDAEKNQS
jgi:hypothetical protein